MSDVIPRHRPPQGLGLYGWFQDRLNIELLWRSLFIRKIPFGVNLLYTLGFVSLALFIVQALTGTILALYYSPSPDHAYDSIEYTITQVPFGQVRLPTHQRCVFPLMNSRPSDTAGDDDEW